MDRPNSEMEALVEAALAMDNRLAAVAYLAKQGVPDRVIARLLSARAERSKRRLVAKWKLVERKPPATR